MPDEPISALVQIAAPSGSPPYPTAFTNPTTGAMLEILDTTNTSMAAAGTNSKIAPGDLIKGYLNAGTNITLTETSGVVTVTASGGSPGGTSGQIQTNNGSGGFGALAVPLGVASGGTGLGTLTAHAVVLGEGTSTPAFATIGTSGRLLIDQGAAADPSFNAMSGDVTITNAGVATVGKIGGTAISLPLSVANGGIGAGTLTAHAVVLGEGTSTPGFATIGTAGRILVDKGAAADPAFVVMSGDVAITSTGATTIQAGAVGLADMANFAASSLMGNPTGSPAAPSAITLGANLSFSGTTLVATAGSGMSNPFTTTGDIVYSTTTASPGAPGRLGIGSTGNVLTVAGGLPSWAAPATSGTVTSVGLSTDSGWMTVASSPVTSSGTITINKTTGLAANKVLASPDGTTGTVSLRSLVNADLTAPGSSGQLIYNNTNVYTGATKLAVGSSGQLNYVPITAPGSPVAGDLWYDSAMNTFGFLSAGVAVQPRGIFWQLVSPGTAVTSPSNGAFNTILAGGTQIGSLTFPANSLAAGKIIKLMVSGKVTIATTTALQIKVLMGSTIVGTGQSTASAATNTNAVIWTDFAAGGSGIQIQAIGATGKVMGIIGRITFDGTQLMAPSGGTVNVAWNGTTGPVATQVTLDTTVSNTLDVQVALVTGSTSSFQITSAWASIEG